MIVLPTDAGVVVVGCLLRDPGEGPWGLGAPDHGPPPAPRSSCSNCGGTGWINEPYYGATLGVRCPCREAS